MFIHLNQQTYGVFLLHYRMKFKFKEEVKLRYAEQDKKTSLPFTS